MRNRIRWVLVVALTIALVYRLYKLGRPEDLVHRAISVCEPCGLTEEEVLRFIDNKARSGLSRSKMFKAWEDTYDDPSDLEIARDLCADCTNAILDAALAQRGNRQQPASSFLG